MKKKVIIWVIVIILVIVAIFVYFRFMPVATTIVTVLSLAIGIVAGWFAHVVYLKYITKKTA
jgi:hypothetical protein